MSSEHPRAAMAKAFRETALSLIGLYQVYDVDPDLSAATAEALAKVFRRHLSDAPPPADATCFSRLHALVDELERAEARAS